MSHKKHVLDDDEEEHEDPMKNRKQKQAPEPA